jgi:hypothetical protein
MVREIYMSTSVGKTFIAYISEHKAVSNETFLYKIGARVLLSFVLH